MIHFANSETMHTETCDALLLKSINNYQNINTLYQDMQNDLSGRSCNKVQQTLETLKSLFKQSYTVECQIAESINQISPLSNSTKALLDQREEILHSLVQANQQTKDKIESVKSLLRYDINNLSTNRNALQGYKPIATERKIIVRNTF